MSSFRFKNQRIAYTEYGGGPAAITKTGARGRTAKSSPAASRPVILVHGLLLSQEMHRPLAEDLAARGNRVITVDLLGHGKSDRPRDMWRYSMSIFGEQVVGVDGPPGARAGGRDGHLAGREHGARDRLGGARALARNGDRDAGARQRAAGKRAGLHPAARRAHLRRAGDEAARARHARGAAADCCPTTATSCSTSSARNPVPAAR